MRRFVIEFLGGSWHGKRLDSHSPDREEMILAQAMYFLTGDGTVGRGLKTFSPEAVAFALKRGWLEAGGPQTAAVDYTVIEQHGEADRKVVVLKHGVKFGG